VADVEQIVVVGIDVASSREAVSLAERYEGLVATVGMHPHDARRLGAREEAALIELAAHPKVVAIGETGLDFYRDRSPREAQKAAFRWHLELARQRGLPVIVHDREAHAETLAMLREHAAGGEIRGVMHCFSGGEAMLEEALGLGLHISLAGPVTYPNAPRLAAVARRVPSDRLLVETDCPYLTPVPHRGRRNEPAYVRLVAQRIAEIRGQSEAEIAAITTANACALFGLDGVGARHASPADGRAEAVRA
jgi:TatD DNase family protein